MSTTSLFVELVVIGSGAALCLCLLVLVLFGYVWVPWSALTSWSAIVPVLSFIYVLGIVLDRLADRVLKRCDKALQQQFFENSETYHEAKNQVYGRSDPMRMLFEYGRSRMRICRGWILNFSALMIIFPMFVLTRLSQVESCNRMLLVAVGTLIIACLDVGTIITWKELSRTFYKRLWHAQRTLQDYAQ